MYKYSKLFRYLISILGEIHYGLVGHLAKLYTIDHIKKCSTKFPEHKKSLSPKQKILYLKGICRNCATDKDLIKRKII